MHIVFQVMRILRSDDPQDHLIGDLIHVNEATQELVNRDFDAEPYNAPNTGLIIITNMPPAFGAAELQALKEAMLQVWLSDPDDPDSQLGRHLFNIDFDAELNTPDRNTLLGPAHALVKTFAQARGKMFKNKDTGALWDDLLS